METFTIEVCGAEVSFDLHPGREQPASKPRSIRQETISLPGNAATFVSAMYEYRRAWRWNIDINVVVEGRVGRRSTKLRDEGVSNFDLKRMLQIYEDGLPEYRHEIVERNDATWIKRTRLDDRPEGRGRNIVLDWVVPLSEDIMLSFSVNLHDYATGGAKLYPAAKEMQDWIFDSLKVTLSPEARREREKFMQDGGE